MLKGFDGEDPESQGRPFRFPDKVRRNASNTQKRPKKPAGLDRGGLAPDAKRYNDEIPDPDSEENVPEE